MKHYILLTAIASVSLVSAMSLSDAQQRLGASQSRVAQVKEKIARLKSESEREQAAASQYVGQEKQGHLVKQHTVASRAASKAHNQAVAELREANAALQAEIAQIGKHHAISSQGERYSVSAAPGPQKATSSASYSQPTTSYSSESYGRMPYSTARTRTVARTVYGR